MPEKKYQIESDIYVPYIDKKNNEDQKALRKAIREAVGSFVANNDEILWCEYAPPSQKDVQKDVQRYDVENRLTYNIGTGCFKDATRHGIGFVARDAEDNRHHYSYKLIPTTDKTSLFNQESIVASWKNVELPTTATPADYWKVIRSAEKIEIKQRLDNPTGFAIRITLYYPQKRNSNANTTNTIKKLLDGIICAFHGDDVEDENFLMNLKKWSKLEKSSVLPTMENGILWKHDYIYKRGNGWGCSPADDYLKCALITVEEGENVDKPYFSGELYRWEDLKPFVLKS